MLKITVVAFRASSLMRPVKRICAAKAALSSPNIRPVGRPNLRRFRKDDFLKRQAPKKEYSLVEGMKTMKEKSASVVINPAMMVAMAAPSMPISGTPYFPKMKT